MADFKKQGGSLTGREERYDGFEGEPRAVGSALGGGSSTGTTGTTGTGLGSTGTGYDNSTGTGHHHGTTGSGLGNTGTTGSGLGNTGSTGSGYDNTTGTTGKKPGLMDRMNPMKDTDGDGKRGVMD